MSPLCPSPGGPAWPCPAVTSLAFLLKRSIFLSTVLQVINEQAINAFVMNHVMFQSLFQPSEMRAQWSWGDTLTTDSVFYFFPPLFSPLLSERDMPFDSLKGPIEGDFKSIAELREHLYHRCMNRCKTRLLARDKVSLFLECLVLWRYSLLDVSY